MLVLSGIDCAGKSTQLEKLNKYFCNNKQKPRIIWSRGGYTPLLEFIKNLIKGKKVTSSKEKNIRDKVHSNLLLKKILLWGAILDLCFYYGIYFRYLRLKGITIIADRYIWDTYIDFIIKYDSVKFEKWIVWKLLLIIYVKPKYSIVLSISPEESMRRSKLKYEPFPETLEERKTRIGLYFNLIDNGLWDHHIDASKSIDEVYNKIVDTIS